jgi:Mce-associated membrane protein
VTRPGPAGSPAGRAAGTPAGTPAGGPPGPVVEPVEAGSAPVATDAPTDVERSAPGRRRFGRRRPTTTMTAATGTGTEPGDAAVDTETPAAGPARRRSGPPWWLFAVVAALAVLGIAATALLLLGRPSDGELRESALTAARSYTTVLTTYDSRTLDDDVERVKRVSTEDFRSQYEQTIEELRETISSGQAVSVGEVIGTGLESLDGDEAVVLVAVNQEITSGGQPPRTEANRVRVTLLRQDGSWFLDDVARL